MIGQCNKATGTSLQALVAIQVSSNNCSVALWQVEGHLEEMVRLAKSSEQFNQYMMGSMQDAVGSTPLDAAVEERFRSGQFTVTVRELIAYYIAMVRLQYMFAVQGQLAVQVAMRKETCPVAQCQSYRPAALCVPVTMNLTLPPMPSALM